MTISELTAKLADLAAVYGDIRVKVRDYALDVETLEPDGVVVWEEKGARFVILQAL